MFYVMVVLMNLEAVANVFQPEIHGLVFRALGNGKVWICILLAPCLAVVPDLFVDCVIKVYYPTPVLAIMKKEKGKFHLEYENKV